MSAAIVESVRQRERRAHISRIEQLRQQLSTTTEAARFPATSGERLGGLRRWKHETTPGIHTWLATNGIRFDSSVQEVSGGYILPQNLA